MITTGKYALLIQKQPGGIIKELKVYTTFDSNILSIGDKTGTAYKLSNQKAYWKTDVLEDKVLEINTK
ncbi:MAG: hypothetical protein NT091_02635 [Candidatus Falkowbacteria bacterium]|nr:hypothetical protein [Candidatus Falkowbacteria bacterium]